MKRNRKRYKVNLCFRREELNQSAEGAGGLGIIRDNKVGESEQRQ